MALRETARGETMTMADTSTYASTHEALAADYAGGAWPTGQRYTPDVDGGILAFLRAHAMACGNVCAWCGDDLGTETLHAAHVYPQGPSRRGRVAGNLVIVHAECNTDDKPLGERPVPLSAIVRPDVIATEWPSLPTLGAMGRAARETRRNGETQRARRARRGL